MQPRQRLGSAAAGCHASRATTASTAWTTAPSPAPGAAAPLPAPARAWALAIISLMAYGLLFVWHLPWPLAGSDAAYAFQLHLGWPADGYPDAKLLEQLRQPH
mgnify:CR=1 FL=1